MIDAAALPPVIKPITDDHSAVYWDAAREGRLLIQRCLTTGAFQFYPRPHCVHCFTCSPEWVEASGRGTLYSYAVVHKAYNPGWSDATPYVYAVVALAEGPHMTTNIVDTPHDQLRCDLPVEVVFVEEHGVTYPKFTAARA